MRLALGQMEVIPGRPDLNTSTILDMVEEARQGGGAQMVIFPEMAVPGIYWEIPGNRMLYQGLRGVRPSDYPVLPEWNMCAVW